MDSLTFTPGRAFLSSDSPTVPWTAVFEDEGPAGYLYACDRSRQTPGKPEQSQEESILDAMLLYNVASLSEPGNERLASVQWSRDGLQAVFYLDGTAQAFLDFAARASFCRSNFPNFVEHPGDTWRKTSHAWDEEAIQRFEAALYN
jgi:hypothetical protein